MSKRYDDLFTKMMVDLMKFPTSLVSPAEKAGLYIRDLDKAFEENKNEWKDFYKEMQEDFKKMNSFNTVRTDVIEKDNNVTIKAEMPGFKKEDISINIEKDFLIISAENKEENLSEGKYVCREIRTGKFQKAFNLEGFNKDTIKAKYENGILYIDIEKLEKKEDDVKKIDIM